MKIKLSTLINSAVIIAGIITGSLAVWLFCADRTHKEQFHDLFFDDTLYADEIKKIAEKYGLRPELVRAVIKRESRFNRFQRGKAGEIGLMQLLPAGSAAEWARINHRPVPSRRQLADVHTNLNIGCWYLARAVKKWSGYRHGTELALAQYNAGEKNAIRWKPPTPDGEVIPRITWPGTRRYVSNIMQNYLRESVNQKKSALP